MGDKVVAEKVEMAEMNPIVILKEV